MTGRTTPTVPTTPAMPTAGRAALLRLTMPGWRRMAPGLCFGALSGLCAVLLLAASAYLITRAAEQPPILYLSLLVVGVRAFALARATFRYLERLSSHDAAFRVLAELRVGLVERLIPLAPARLGGRRRGDLLARMVSDVDQLLDRPTRVIQPLVSSAIVALAAVAGVAFLDPSAAALLAGLLVVAATAGTLLHGALAARAERRTAGLRGRLADEILELVADLDVLLAYDAVEAQLRRVEDVDARLRRTALRSAAGTGVASAVLAAASGAAVLGLLLVGLDALEPPRSLGPGFLPRPGEVDPAMLAVLALVPLAVFDVVAAVPPAISARRGVLASARRIVDVASEPPGASAGTSAGSSEEPPAPDPSAPDPSAPALELIDVAVRRPGATAPVSAPVTLRLRAGERAVVTGPSGVGKTALAQGLVGLLDHVGTLRVGGVDAAALTGEQLRRRVCLIEQDAHLFDATIRANLALAHPQGPEQADDAALWTVLEAVGLGGWAQAREGLDTPVGMDGVLLSGGQARRIAVARGLLSGAEVLVLDEPTAHVDPAMADRLHEELLGAAGDRAVVLLSHVPVADRLVDHRVRLRAAGDEPDSLI
ncbi:thiol reductant ABC exporter subunit CydC [Nesterenkonia sp. F]|uniref:thiol reductant ABC exporter subunit CydC n=1 Tax=Nesterenkonia sp. F TaxID=795955 RepID=UPI0003076276|nr:thiol reductant ABC exporter subunit CydC [Nesterenkonia sp. F]